MLSFSSFTQPSTGTTFTTRLISSSPMPSTSTTVITSGTSSLLASISSTLLPNITSSTSATATPTPNSHSTNHHFGPGSPDTPDTRRHTIVTVSLIIGLIVVFGLWCLIVDCWRTSKRGEDDNWLYHLRQTVTSPVLRPVTNRVSKPIGSYGSKTEREKKGGRKCRKEVFMPEHNAKRAFDGDMAKPVERSDREVAAGAANGKQLIVQLNNNEDGDGAGMNPPRQPDTGIGDN
ncbi:uncharacterized protein BCR38DRAFT_405905 [Pseudomassariella vexata]|uniref:Uncharacterized protein n=1 Tax=Pseudomassariella vexata TaxID=1141098 RepID=A0A1Y2EFC4_9PEZI|nr:uncharacterized protein BCR38DRAFT_405905 [Pseudomassariella vexata]ORY70288.1 hypothetical protein BCR38DRAFT_405905 [Pseudomassariella vexata]